MIPIDSSEAREQREASTAAAEAEVLHASVCRGTLLGVTADERPVPCPVCRPELYAGVCPTCAVPRTYCEHRRRHAGRRCCDACHHTPAPSLEACLAHVEAPEQPDLYATTTHWKDHHA